MLHNETSILLSIVDIVIKKGQELTDYVSYLTSQKLLLNSVIPVDESRKVICSERNVCFMLFHEYAAETQLCYYTL